MIKIFVLPLAMALMILVTCSTASWVGYTVATPSGFTPVATSGNSTFYTVDAPSTVAPNFGYDSPVYLLVLQGSHYDMGYVLNVLLHTHITLPLPPSSHSTLTAPRNRYDYGKLVGSRVTTLASLFLHNLISKDAVLQDAVREFCVWQYEDYLGHYTPEIYVDEISGIEAADPAAARDVKTIITLANFPGTITDLKYVLEREIFGPHGPSAADYAAGYGDVVGDLERHLVGVLGMEAERASVLAAGFNALVAAEYESFGCSMFAIWGSRTDDGSVYSARNLDWSSATGAATGKMVTVFKPNDGGNAHMTAGFIGFYGSLAGVSSKGISVHEANLEEDEISFYGMPWVLRLRYIMEKSDSLDSALSLWDDEHNTVGFNFGIMSNPDTAGVVIETNDEISQVFADDSPMEADAHIMKDGERIQLGYPMKDAVYRTNAPYGNVTMKDYLWSIGATSNSQLRYRLIQQGFLDYQEAGVKVGLDQALNITAIVAQKGKQEPSGDPYHCPPAGQPTPNGSSVLSVTNQLNTLTSLIAWGNGPASSWRSACCNTYIVFDLSKWLL